MFESKIFFELLYQLEYDKRYHSIDNRFERMYYFVNRYSKLLTHYAGDLNERFRRHELEHRKSYSIVNDELNRVKMIYDRFHQESSLSKTEYDNMRSACDRALRFTPILWDDWRAMCIVLRIYSWRAEIEFTHHDYKLAVSDLRHACSVMKHFNRSLYELYEYFSRQDCDLPALVIRLQMKMIDRYDKAYCASVRHDIIASNCLLRMSNVGKPLSIQTFDDFVNIFCIIRQLDDIIKIYDQNENAERETKDEPLLSDYENLRISNKIRLCASDRKGRFYVSNDTIGKDEIILIERAQMTVIFQSRLFEYCHQCHRKMNTFWPCSTCAEIGYCSAKCAQLDRTMHQHECGIIGLMLKNDIYTVAHTFRTYVTFGADLIINCELQELRKKPSFDVEKYIGSMTNIGQALSKFPDLACRAHISLLSHQEKRSKFRERAYTLLSVAVIQMLIHKDHIRSDVIANDRFAFAYLLEYIGIEMLRLGTNGFCWSDCLPLRQYPRQEPNNSKIASVICFAASFFNHSCSPNISWLVDSGGIICLRAKRDIAPDQPLTICYNPTTKFAQRQQSLYEDYCFFCCCQKCMFEIASQDYSLRCLNQAQVPRCPGPLVVRPFDQFEVCFECYRSGKQNFEWHESGDKGNIDKRVVQNVTNIVKNASQKFTHVMRRIFQKKNFFQTNAKHIWYFFGKKQLRKFVKPENDQDSLTDAKDRTGDEALGRFLRNKWPNTTKKICTRPTNITERRVAKLEKYFNICVRLSYGGCFHLLEKCVILLAVYNEIAIETSDKSDIIERSFRLLPCIDSAIVHIYPEILGCEQVNLIYMLDFVVRFYERIFTKESKYTRKFNLSLYTIYHRVSRKIIDILQYDLLHKGNFLSRFRKHSNGKDLKIFGTDRIDDQIYKSLESSLNIDKGIDDELYFLRVLQGCKKRIKPIDCKLEAINK